MNNSNNFQIPRKAPGQRGGRGRGGNHNNGYGMMSHNDFRAQQEQNEYQNNRLND